MSEPSQSLCLFLPGVQDEEKAFPLDKNGMVIGRSSSCDIILPDMTVSKKHAQIFIYNGRTLIADGVDGKPSANGVYVNDARISGRVTLKEGDEVKLGVFRFEVRTSAPSKRVASVEEISTPDDLKLFLKFGDTRKVREESLIDRVSSLDMDKEKLVNLFDSALDLAMAEHQLQRVGFISRIKQRAINLPEGGARFEEAEVKAPVTSIGDDDETLIDTSLAMSYYDKKAEKRRKSILIGVLFVAAALLVAVAAVFILF